ncbi:MAG: hypothetical protein AAGJ35_10395, partial [Myxococcota bacterium]
MKLWMYGLSMGQRRVQLRLWMYGLSVCVVFGGYLSDVYASRHQVLFSKGYVQYKKKRYKKAAALFERAYQVLEQQKRQNGKQALHYFMGVCYVSLGRKQEAAKLL